MHMYANSLMLLLFLATKSNRDGFFFLRKNILHQKTSNAFLLEIKKTLPTGILFHSFQVSSITAMGRKANLLFILLREDSRNG